MRKSTLKVPSTLNNENLCYPPLLPLLSSVVASSSMGGTTSSKVTACVQKAPNSWPWNAANHF